MPRPRSHLLLLDLFWACHQAFGRQLPRARGEHLRNGPRRRRDRRRLCAEAQRVEKAVSPEQMLNELKMRPTARWSLATQQPDPSRLRSDRKACRNQKDIVEPFFVSMRMDLTEKEHDQSSLRHTLWIG